MVTKFILCLSQATSCLGLLYLPKLLPATREREQGIGNREQGIANGEWELMNRFPSHGPCGKPRQTGTLFPVLCSLFPVPCPLLFGPAPDTRHLEPPLLAPILPPPA